MMEAKLSVFACYFVLLLIAQFPLLTVHLIPRSVISWRQLDQDDLKATRTSSLFILPLSNATSLVSD